MNRAAHSCGVALLLVAASWSSAPATAEAGDIITLHFQIRAWPDGHPATEAQLIYRWRGWGARGRGIKRAPVESDGSITFSSVQSGMKYTLWVPLPEDRYVLLHDVEVSEEAIAVDRVKGATSRVRLEAPEGIQVSGCRVSAVRLGLGGVRVWANEEDDGVYRLSSLPPGPWQVIASCPSPDGPLRGLVTVEAGEDATIHLVR